MKIYKLTKNSLTIEPVFRTERWSSGPTERVARIGLEKRSFFFERQAVASALPRWQITGVSPDVCRLSHRCLQVAAVRQRSTSHQR